MKPERILRLDPLVHAPVRLAVLTLLAGLEDADFVFVRDSTGATDGNLSSHLSKLEEAGYVRISKGFAGKKPRTTCAITNEGRTALIRYLEDLQAIVETQKPREET